MLGRIASASLATLISVAFGQTFEVASVKPSDPALQGRGGPQGGPGTADPGRITYYRATLQRLIREAYGVNFDQIQGPAWIAEENYDIIAKVPPGSTKEQVERMLQNLLEERFKLAFHRVTQDFPVYELTIGKGGSKLKENTDTLEPSRPGDARLPPDRDGYPQIPPGKSASMGAPGPDGLTRAMSRGMPLSILVFELGARLGTTTGPNTYAPGRIVDKTGLVGKYDFKLEYSGSSGIGTAATPASLTAATDPSGGPSFIEAIEKQLGLKLTKSTAPFELLVIDHAEKMPTEN